ncbi:hypothetical protein BTUL_0501g00010 [Botrytis tulipae]|uniref:Endonuclease/exonuclease/phosphatase domain-containing protein n=1 Tax=Botrytis tulipae TaxID=87230 RepID=A0A4Z1E463_9HELO|nr:hypothetical protein BTUL_0501g00010 [Botrytis tulipae]
MRSAPIGSTNTDRSEARRLKRENDRIEKTILIIADGEALLSETSPFLLRLRIKEAVTGITLAEIPYLQRNNTGWTLRCSSSASREEIMKTENVEQVLKALNATSMRKLERWFVYAVPQVPHDFYHIAGAPAPMPSELIKEEIIAQTGKQPVSYRLARSGVDPLTKRATWIITFNSPITRFQLFNSSSYSVLLDKPQEIKLHSTGCQGTLHGTVANEVGGSSDPPSLPTATPTASIIPGARITAYENERLSKRPRRLSTSLPIAPTTLRTRSARSQSQRNLNIEALAEKAFTPIDLEMSDVETSITTLPMNNTIDEYTQRNRGLTIAWANVGRGHANHITLLQLAAEAQLDVICVQEPKLYWNSTTQNHNAYDRYQPIDNWNLRGGLEENEQGPRVMTYIRKGASLKVEQMSRLENRDLLWIRVNGYSILNVYRAPCTLDTINYITHLVPNERTIVGGDFNAKHDLWEPGVITANQGAQLATWASEQGMEFIGTPGIATHARGHVIDLTFSNVPFAYTEVLEELHCGSDHATQVTILTNHGTTEWDQYHYRIKEGDLPRLDGLMANQLAHLNDVDIQTTTEIETHVSELANALDKAIRAIGKIDRKVGKASPWWTDECREAHRAHIEARRGSDPERKTNATHLLQKPRDPTGQCVSTESKTTKNSIGLWDGTN